RDQVKGEWQMDVIWYSLGLSIRSPLFAIAYDTFRGSPALDPATQGRLLKTFLGAARWLAEEHDAFRYGNWQHHGVTGLFELAMFWPEFHEAAEWSEIAWARLLEHLELDVYPDGGHLERAPSYHTGVLNGYIKVALAAEMGWRARLQDQPRFPAMFHWLMDQTTPRGCSTNSNDSGPVWVGPVMAQGAVLCGDPTLKWFAEQLGTPAEIERTLSTLPNRPDGRTAAEAFAALASEPPVDASTLQPFSKFAIMRSGWGADDHYLAISYGPHVGHELESHSHRDPLSFVCYADGAPLAIEAGGPDSYDDPRYYDWYQAAQSHNVLLVDGEEPTPEGKDAELLTWAPSPVADLFQAAHDGYGAAGVEHQRTVIFVHDDYWFVHDEVRQNRPHRLDWQLYFPGRFTLDGHNVIPTERPGLMVLPHTTSDDVNPIHGVMVVPGPRAYEGTYERREAYGVRYSRQATGMRETFVNLLYPVTSDDTRSAAAITPLEVSGTTAEACAVETAKGRDLLVITGSDNQQPWQVEQWRSNARILVARTSGAWTASDVQHIAHADTLVFAATAVVRSAAFWPAGNGFAGQIVTRRATTITLPRPDAGVVITVNGIEIPTSDSDNGPSFLLPAEGAYRITVTEQ
ncbi:MAG TPA: alginate lyase family protein, partial [Thermomicrobiales bacterium]|nr:alginate lyase family protein [Thermomicrobiales bacterium]